VNGAVLVNTLFPAGDGKGVDVMKFLGKRVIVTQYEDGRICVYRTNVYEGDSGGEADDYLDQEYPTSLGKAARIATDYIAGFKE
jgi:hypothetical protein